MGGEWKYYVAATPEELALKIGEELAKFSDIVVINLSKVKADVLQNQP